MDGGKVVELEPLMETVVLDTTVDLATVAATDGVMVVGMVAAMEMEIPDITGIYFNKDTLNI